jgi:hypothetical protein
MRGAIEPLALTAAIVAAGMAVVYVWLIGQQGNQPLPWVLIVLVAGALLAAYGALWRVPYRRAALVPAVITLTVLGVLGILSIGLAILAAGILALVSLLRPGRHQALVPFNRRGSTVRLWTVPRPCRNSPVPPTCPALWSRVPPP